MNLIFALDTEDYVTPQAWDAQLWWMQTLKERNIQGSFQLVGELVKTWVKEGRQDLLEAIRHHEVGYHTQWHSLHPVHVSALYDKDLQEGIQWVLSWESEGFNYVKEKTGKQPISFTAPGINWTPHSFLAMSLLGAKVAGAFNWGGRDWYSGLLSMPYDLCFDDYFGRSAEDAFSAFKSDFLKLKPHLNTLCLYTHPTRLVTSAFWDAQLAKGHVMNREDLQPAPLHTEAQIEEHKSFVRQAFSWLSSQGHDFTTMEAYYNSHPEPKKHIQDLLKYKNLNESQYNELLGQEEGEQNGFHYRWTMIPEGYDYDNLHTISRQLNWTRHFPG